MLVPAYTFSGDPEIVSMTQRVVGIVQRKLWLSGARVFGIQQLTSGFRNVNSCTPCILFPSKLAF